MYCKSDLQRVGNYLPGDDSSALNTSKSHKDLDQRNKCFNPNILNACGDLFGSIANGMIMQTLNTTRASSLLRLYIFQFCEHLLTMKVSTNILTFRYTNLSYWTDGNKCTNY